MKLEHKPIPSLLLAGSLLTGCAFGYAGSTRAYGIAAGDARLAACSAEQDACPTIEGGTISEPFSKVMGNLFGAVTNVLGGAFRGILSGISGGGSDSE